jgi:hypothetical protein
MGDNYEVGDFGEASFKFTKKGFEGGVKAFGTVRDIDGKYVLFIDNDDFPYLIKKDKFSFKKAD